MRDTIKSVLQSYAFKYKQRFRGRNVWAFTPVIPGHHNDDKTSTSRLKTI